MPRSLRLPVLLAIVLGVCFGSGANARERPVFCNPPNITVAARGTIVGGRLCNGPWGCSCAHFFCPQCSTLPTSYRPAVLRMDDLQAAFRAAAAQSLAVEDGRSNSHATDLC